VAWLSYADRLYQLPLGVVGIAIGIVLLPDLSRRLRAGDTRAGAQLQPGHRVRAGADAARRGGAGGDRHAAVSVLFSAAPSGADDTAATALALAIYGVGLPAFVLQKVLQPLYYAREDTRRPFRYAVWSMVVNAAWRWG
jgi:putative peptidoglycan lipid II flippase